MNKKLLLLPAVVIAVALVLTIWGKGFMLDKEPPAAAGTPYSELYQADIKLAEKINPYEKYAVPALHKEVKKAAAGLKTKEPAGEFQTISINTSPENKIVLYPDRRLRLASLPVNRVDDDMRSLIAHMKNTVRELNGLGLSAPQVGVNLRIIVLYIDGEFIELINPQITSAKGSKSYTEGCFSLPWVSGEVKRHAGVIIQGIGSDGRPVEHVMSGVKACIVQHEIDHLDGILFIDRADYLEKVEP